MKLLYVAASMAPLLFSPIESKAGEVFDEIRFGGSGLVDSDSSKDRGFVGSAEVFISPLGSSEIGIHKALTPRVQVGVSAGASATDQIYAAFNWHFPIGDTFFVEAGLGGTIHNGNLDTGDGPRLGCRLLFRENVVLGMKVTEKVSLMATADHSSHASLCDGPNDGLTHAGLAVGVKF